MRFIYCLLYLVIESLLIFILGRLFPRKMLYYNKFPFKSFKFEDNGKIYEKLKVKKWKTMLPDASVIVNKIIPKKHIEKIFPTKRIKTNDQSKVEILVKETCIAESNHFWVSVLGFGCCFIWKNGGGLIVSLIYVIHNIPYIIIQRYNRPRMVRVINNFR